MTLSSPIYEVFEPPMPEGLIAGRKNPSEAAFDKGRAEGLAEGLLAGRQEGKAEGKAAGLAEGREAGLEEGRQGALSEAERQKLSALDAFAALLQKALDERAEAEARLAADVATAARAALGALLPRLAQRGLADEIAVLCEELMRDAALGHATLVVAPEQEPAAIAALEARRAQSGGGAEIELVSDPSVKPAEARLEWGDGLAGFDGEEASARILTRLDACIEAMRPAAEACAAEAGPAEAHRTT